MTATTNRNALIAALALAALALPAAEAGAVSANVKSACMGDYFQYCSSHQVGSTSLRRCMRSVGHKLSKRCVNALVAAGEVSKSEVTRRASR